MNAERRKMNADSNSKKKKVQNLLIVPKKEMEEKRTSADNLVSRNILGQSNNFVQRIIQ